MVILLMALAELAALTAAADISTWTMLNSSIASAAGKAVVLNLSNSFEMTGYPAYVSQESYCMRISAAGTDITINGNNAVFDAKGKGQFFCVVGNDSTAPVRLTVSNVRFKNGSADPNPGPNRGGAINIGAISLVTLINCSFSGNTAWGGGAIWAGSNGGTVLLILGGEFKQPISQGNNDIELVPSRTNVTFGCAPGLSGASVQISDEDLTVIPPKALKCTATADEYRCINNTCVQSAGGIPKAECSNVCGAPTQYICHTENATCIPSTDGISKAGEIMSL
jgi:hypothetical protein